MASEIDAKGDYTLEPLADAKDMVVREKNPRHATNTVLAIFADTSIKALPAPSDAKITAIPPATTPPTRPTETPAPKSTPAIASISPLPASPSPSAGLEKPKDEPLPPVIAPQMPASGAKTSPPPPPPPLGPTSTALGDQVLVPNLADFDSVPTMKAALVRNGLVGSFIAKNKPPSKELEFKFAGQSPPANTKVKRGSKVEVFIYQKFEETTTGVTTTPSTAASATPNTQGEEVVVPNLAQFDSVSKMKAALERVGLVGTFNAKGKPPTKELEFKFASQLPEANAKAKRGAMVAVFIYQKFEEAGAPPMTSSPSSSSPAARATPTAAWSPTTTRRDSGDPFANLEGAKWMGSWRGKVMRTGEPIAGGGAGDYEELTLIRRVDGTDVWVHGSSPVFYYEVGNGKMRFKTKDTSPPRYAELEQRGDHWAGRWVEGDKVLATFDLAPIPKPKWLTNF